MTVEADSTYGFVFLPLPGPPVPFQPYIPIALHYALAVGRISNGFRTKYRKNKISNRKISKAQNIEVAEYRVAKYRNRKISKMQYIESHNIEWQNIDHAKY